MKLIHWLWVVAMFLACWGIFVFTFDARPHSTALYLFAVGVLLFLDHTFIRKAECRRGLRGPV